MTRAKVFWALTAACACFSAEHARAQGITEWQASAIAVGAKFIEFDITSPQQFDIGTFELATGGGVSYEILYNAQVGGLSSAFLGSLGAPVGDSAGLKLDQYPNSGTFGATAFGVADYTGVTPNVYGADTQVVYVADGTDISLYVNGEFAETFAGASFALSGLTGFGHAYNHGADASVDALNGTLLGVAIYDVALDADDVAANYAAFVPEPTSIALAIFSVLGLVALRRRS